LANASRLIVQHQRVNPNTQLGHVLSRLLSLVGVGIKTPLFKESRAIRFVVLARLPRSANSAARGGS
jgi:hypothetical protein